MYFNKKSCYFLIIIPLFYTSFCFGQDPSPDKVYQINKKLEMPLALVLFAGDFAGFNHLANKPGLSLAEANQLSSTDIWKFDRVATKQDASFRDEAQNISDVILNASALLPGLLAFDNEIKKDWFDLLVLYGETHAINSGIYVSVASLTWRPRPFNYHPEVPLLEKMENETKNSFFSGHVSSVASASFFMAKVYSDYHPELGKKKYWLYGAALVPPVLEGFYRIKAMKHFPSDVIVGGIIGASIGIIVPHLHKTNMNSKLSFTPFTGRATGLRLAYSL